MEEKLFKDFEAVSAKAWKQKIQVDLKGADYNEKLITKTLHGVDIKPFYHQDDVVQQFETTTKEPWKIAEQIHFDHGIEKAIEFTKDVIERGAEFIWVVISKSDLDYASYFKSVAHLTTDFYIEYQQPNSELSKILLEACKNHSAKFEIGIDPLHHFASTGNWWQNLEKDQEIWCNLLQETSVVLQVDARLFQQAGATIPQQLAYTLAQFNEYMNWANHFSIDNLEVKLINAAGSNYFFEIAKLKTLPYLLESLLEAYENKVKFSYFSIPTKRNKTLYDYNVNMLRTTTECMSAVLGGSHVVANLAYDEIYHKTNEFGERISRNQLLMLKEESYFDKVENPTDGAYYIDALVSQFTENAWSIFKQLEQGGGFVQQLFEGKIQQKIKASSEEEIKAVEAGDFTLVGTNKYQNAEDQMKNELKVSPFLEKSSRKTLIEPIVERRIAEAIEQKRMANE